MNSHLREINETYLEHMYFAQKCGWRMVFAGLACVVHSIVPNFFVNTASNALRALSQEIMDRKNKSQLS
jgi:hypothetical protein